MWMVPLPAQDSSLLEKIGCALLSQLPTGQVGVKDYGVRFCRFLSRRFFVEQKNVGEEVRVMAVGNSISNQI